MIDAGCPYSYFSSHVDDRVGPSEEAFGRPVGVAIAKGGALLLADDVGNAVWRVTATDAGRSTAR